MVSLTKASTIHVRNKYCIFKCTLKVVCGPSDIRDVEEASRRLKKTEILRSNKVLVTPLHTYAQ
ncbi:hypothetical protein T492DRAFT_1101625 [Pavlovales sp. CCMP2436]|nr:hypothetical protein T492DRAFT_1101625 [Pavlovales sp. CCMP2436]